MAEQQEDVGASQTAKLDRLIEDLRDIASSQPTSPFTSPVSLAFKLKQKLFPSPPYTPKKKREHCQEFDCNVSL